MEQLHELQHKLQFLKAQEFKDAKAAGDVRDVVENLKFKVIFYLIDLNIFRKFRQWRKFELGC